jgi:hypothetical protein
VLNLTLQTNFKITKNTQTNKQKIDTAKFDLTDTSITIPASWLYGFGFSLYYLSPHQQDMIRIAHTLL